MHHPSFTMENTCRDPDCILHDKPALPLVTKVVCYAVGDYALLFTLIFV